MRKLLIDLALFILRGVRYQFPVELREVYIPQEKLVQIEVERPYIVEHRTHTIEHPEPRIIEKEVPVEVFVDRPVLTSAPWEIGEELHSVARSLISEQDTAEPGTSGEFKRHQVYSQLIKQFPDVPKRKLGLAIEVVCSESSLP